MKAFLITPHDDPDYDTCIIENEKEARKFIEKITDELWDNLEYGGKFKLEVEYRKLTDEESRSI